MEIHLIPSYKIMIVKMGMVNLLMMKKEKRLLKD